MPYVYDNADADEHRRLRSLQANLDPPTFAILTELGVTQGWTCWEVGAGAGSVARWLAEQTGPSGRVLATDLDVSPFQVSHDRVNLVEHDVVSDSPPEGPFDLVHARLVLEHLPQRDEVLKTLAAAVKPGGWLVVADSLAVGLRASPSLPETERFNAAMRLVAARAGWDTTYGERLVGQMMALGLTEVHGRGHAGINPPGEMWIAYQHTIRRLRNQLVETGEVTDGELDKLDAALTTPNGDTTFITSGIATVWGRQADD